MGQRDMLRKLVERYGSDDSILIRAYAAAERRGEVERKSNDKGISAEDYARALIADARRKGWARGLR